MESAEFIHCPTCQEVVLPGKCKCEKPAEKADAEAKGIKKPKK